MVALRGFMEDMRRSDGGGKVVEIMPCRSIVYVSKKKNKEDGE